jgi:hypothetical protein
LFVIFFVIFCNAGGTLLMVVWLFSGMILSESYGGILRASLLAEEFEKPMETFQGKRGWQETLDLPYLTLLCDNSKK